MEGENSRDAFDSTYNTLTCSEDVYTDEHSYSNHRTPQVSVSMVRHGSSWSYNKRLTVGLTVLAVVLLALDIGLGVYYSRLTNSQRMIMDIGSEVAKLQTTYNAAIHKKEEILKELEKEIAAHQITKWEIEHQKRSSGDYERQAAKLQTDIASLKSQLPTLQEGCRHCLPGWMYINSVCYYFAFSANMVRRSWQEARQFCQTKGSDLVVVNNRQEHMAITDIIFKQRDPSRPISYEGFWLGLRDSEIEGIWKWVDGALLTESYWNRGEPNNQNNEDCAATYPRDNPFMAWNDAPCNHPLKWICEKSPESV